MKTRRNLSAISTLLFTASLAHGARASTPLPPIPDKLTVKAATSIALQRNPSVRESREKIEDADAQVGLAKSALYPTLQGSLSGNYKKDATNSSAFKFNGEPYNSYLLDLKLSETVGFGIGDGLALPSRDKELRQLDLETSSRDLSSKVINAFYKVLLDQKLLEALLQTESIEKESLATAQRRYQIGRGQLLDVLQVKTQLALLSPKIAQARNQIQIDASTLVNLIGAPDMKEIHLQGNLLAIPYPKIQERLASIKSRFPEIEKLEVSQRRLISEREVTFGKNLPFVTASLDWNRSTFTKSELLDSASTAWTFGLQLTVPIFTGLSSLQERRSYASKASQLDLQQENLKNELALQQTQSSKNLLLGWESISSATEAFNLAGDSLKEAKKNYQLATIDFLQYLSVQQSYLEARSSLFQAEYNYISSLTAHFVATGAPLDELIALLEEKT